MVDIDENTNLSTSQLFLATLTAITLRNKSNTSASGKKKKNEAARQTTHPTYRETTARDETTTAIIMHLQPHLKAASLLPEESHFP